MTRVRTLPIRLAPADGEALDSWLEALAHRSGATWGDIVMAVGLPPTRFGTFSSIVEVNPAVAASTSASTGIPEATVHAMTLARYGNTPLRSGDAPQTVSRGFPWARIRGSRYCPHCLEDSGGRWQLRWRLNWSFSCLVHRCLLADVCPRCAGPQRIHALPNSYSPEPGRCAYLPGRRDTNSRTRCKAELAQAVVPLLGHGHQITAAQRLVYDVFDSGTATFDVYDGNPQPSVHALADIRRLAAHLLATERRAALNSAVGLDHLGVCYDSRRAQIRSSPGHAGAAEQWATTLQSGVAAIGITAACMALRTPSSRPAHVIPSRSHPSRPPAERSALGPRVNASDELRHRARNVVCAVDQSDPGRLEDLVRRTPSMLWPAWSLRFALPDRSQRQIRAVLPALLLLVDTPLRLAEATKLLSSPADKQSVSRILQSLAARSDWPATRTALGRLSDWLATHDTPIDYQRRRRLDYAALLPEEAWTRICRDTGTPGAHGAARARLVRMYLYERLSGLPTDSAWAQLLDNAVRLRLAEFPRHLTPELADALEGHCREFLASNEVENEPPYWSPPTDVLVGLRLPGPDPETVDVAAMHRLLSNAKRPLGQIASRLGTTLDVVRYLTERDPAPAGPPKTPHHARVRGEGLRRARSALTAKHLARLYLVERKGLQDIAAEVGVGRSTITRLAREYGLPLRPAQRRAHPMVDRDWLYEQYVTEGRTLKDIAGECGMSSSVMCRQAKKLEIPLRPYRRPSERIDPVASRVPPLLRPAVAAEGGWKRLERFAASAEYPSLRSAKQQLGLGQIGPHVQRLEADLNTQLLIRARPGGPAMALTDAGQQVLAAVRVLHGTQKRHTAQ
jgi:AraC-like DNA-binding protein